MAASSSFNIIYEEGDIINATEDYICHQCNCVSTGAAGLAKALFNKYKWANTYIHRTPDEEFKHFDKPGTVAVMHNGVPDIPNIVNMYAQYRPGKPHKTSIMDGREARLKYFESCLNHMMRFVREPSSFSFPYGIGCGLAEGNWDDYHARIQWFAGYYSHLITYVKIYRKI